MREDSEWKFVNLYHHGHESYWKVWSRITNDLYVSLIIYMMETGSWDPNPKEFVGVRVPDLLSVCPTQGSVVLGYRCTYLPTLVTPE